MNQKAGLVFDEKHLRACIHCGYCLPVCPTYTVLGHEADSPRGRIYFMRAVADGRASVTGNMREHLDRCLTCYACENACPSGVQYRRLIEDARFQLSARGHGGLPAGFRLFFRHVLTSARMTRLALSPLWAAQAVGLKELLVRAVRLLPLSWMSASMDLLPARVPSPFARPPSGTWPARGETKIRVGFMIGCVMEGMLPDLNRLYISLLRELGCEVVVPEGQGCCGAFAMHEGERELAVRQATALMGTFERAGVDLVVANAAGCGSAMKDYGRLIPGGKGEAFAGKVKDFTEVAAALAAKRPPTREVRLRVAYQEACHLGQAQRITLEPRALLRAIPGLELVELPEQEICCGSAGVYNVLESAMAGELNRRKIGHIIDARVDAVVTANPGCYLQLASGLRAQAAPARLYHLAELLALGYGITVYNRKP